MKLMQAANFRKSASATPTTSKVSFVRELASIDEEKCFKGHFLKYDGLVNLADFMRHKVTKDVSKNGPTI